MKLPMLSADDKHAEIRRLYFKTTRQTIQQDLEKALDLLKSMTSDWMIRTHVTGGTRGAG